MRLDHAGEMKRVLEAATVGDFGDAVPGFIKHRRTAFGAPPPQITRRGGSYPGPELEDQAIPGNSRRAMCLEQAVGIAKMFLDMPEKIVHRLVADRSGSRPLC